MLSISLNSDFGLMGADGNFILGQKEGLLLYKSGTVCNEGFTDQSANVVCQKMGYHGMKSWRSGHVFGDIQSQYQVALGSVECNSDDWRTCEISTANTCGHENDVVLTCHGEILSALRLFVLCSPCFKLRETEVFKT